MPRRKSAASTHRARSDSPRRGRVDRRGVPSSRTRRPRLARHQRALLGITASAAARDGALARERYSSSVRSRLSSRSPRAGQQVSYLVREKCRAVCLARSAAAPRLAERLECKDVAPAERVRVFRTPRSNGATSPAATSRPPRRRLDDIENAPSAGADRAGRFVDDEQSRPRAVQAAGVAAENILRVGRAHRRVGDGVQQVRLRCPGGPQR